MQIDFKKVSIETIDDLDLDDIVGGVVRPCVGI
jgi:hypothetical protein